MDEITVIAGERVTTSTHHIDTQTNYNQAENAHHPLSRDHGYIYLGHGRGGNLKSKEREGSRRLRVFES